MDFLKIILLLSIVVIYAEEIFAKPSKNNIFGRTENLSRCENDPKIDIDCQKCAKITKSNVVYPMCCTEKDDAYRWCLSYMHFGLHKRSGSEHTLFSRNQVKNHWLYKKYNHKNHLDEDDGYSTKEQAILDNHV